MGRPQRRESRLTSRHHRRNAEGNEPVVAKSTGGGTSAATSHCTHSIADGSFDCPGLVPDQDVGALYHGVELVSANKEPGRGG